MTIKRFEWSNTLRIGIDAMDEEHRELIGLMKNVFLENEKSANKPQLTESVNRLIGFTRKHFADEEKLMTEMGFPDFQKHKAQHAEILSRLDKDFEHFKKSPSSNLTDGFFSFLLFWLKNHIQNADRQYSNHFNRSVKTNHP